MTITRPEVSEFSPYYGTYINKVEPNNLVAALIKNREIFSTLIETLPAGKADYRYADGKWTVKEIITHITDAERIFAYRALRFSRKDKTPLAGFDDNDYANTCNAKNQSIEQLGEEFISVRNASISLFKSFTPEMCLCTGHANGNEISVRALGFIIVGHCIHHQQTIQELYLK